MIHGASPGARAALAVDGRRALLLLRQRRPHLLARRAGAAGRKRSRPPSRAGRVTLEEPNDVFGQKLGLLEGGEVPAAIEACVPNHIVAVADPRPADPQNTLQFMSSGHFQCTARRSILLSRNKA